MGHLVLAENTLKGDGLYWLNPALGIFFFTLKTGLPFPISVSKYGHPLSLNKERFRVFTFMFTFKLLLNSLNHILNYLLRITKDHHGFIHVEELIV